MSLLTSPPDGLALLGWRRIVLTALTFCLAPAILGGVALLIIWLLGPEVLGQHALRAELLATLAAVSPLIGLPVWASIAAGTWWLLRRGSFGWLPAAIMGTLPFLVLTRAGTNPAILPFGVAAVLVYRMALALQQPEAV